MILVIGAAASGKRDYVRSLGYKDADMSGDISDGRPVLYGLQDIVAKAPMEAVGLAEELYKKQVVVCDEVGSGVIPVVRQEREAREQTGRLCILLAKKADTVVRLVCGIPTMLKG